MNAELQDQCRMAALRTVEWLALRLDASGSMGSECADLACYYKAPYLMQLAGRPLEARHLLNTISAQFQQSDGDFLTATGRRTSDPVLAAYPAYMSGWIAMAAHKLGCFGLSFPSWRYLTRFWHEGPPGFSLEPRGNGDTVLEVLTCSHLGLLALYLGDLDRARGAGHALRRFLELQPSPSNQFFLRMSAQGELQTEFPAEAEALHVVHADQPGQAWFFIGYPMAFLCRLYRATGQPEMLSAARGYGAFAERCRGSMVGEHFAHKVAWGAAELAVATGEATPRSLSKEIVGHLLKGQGREGTWMREAALPTRIDQSAEVAIWLLEVSALLG